MTASKPLDKEKRLIKLLFWCLAAPMLALMFFRLFFVLFRMVYGSFLIVVLGAQVTNTVWILSLLTALVFTAGAILYTYNLLKVHIINQ